jgi:predicted ATP-grasp superfamily ATP-dependent carboligase
MFKRKASGDPLACVIGSIDLVRPLGLAGIRCAVVAHPTNVARFSRFTDSVIEWADPWRQPDELVERLIRFARSRPERPVLYYEGDSELLLISRERARLEPWFRFLMPDAEAIDDLVDKARFMALAERLELPVPATAFLTSRDDWSDVGLRFPIVVKPTVRRTATWQPLAHGAKALRVETADELGRLHRRFAGSGVELLAQELIDGPETMIESYHVYVDADGRTVGELTGRKIRTLPARYGRSTAIQITDEPEVFALGRELTSRLAIRGVAKLDFKRDAGGRRWLLEVNPRFSLWHHPAARAGVNLPALVYRDLVGWPRAEPTTARAGVRWVYREEDARAAREAGIPLRRWLPWALACETRSGVSLDDPLPLVRGALTLLEDRVRARGRA